MLLSPVSSLVASLAFLDDEHQTASDTGKARLLDGSNQHGPSAWHVRMPEYEEFCYFEQGTDPISARAADLLAWRCGIRTIAERPGSHRQMTSILQHKGSFLLKTPHLCIPDLHAPRSFTIVDIKVATDPAASSCFIC